MKFKWRQLLFSFLVFDFVTEHQRDILLGQFDFFENFNSKESTLLFFSNFFSFLLYPFCSYLVLYIYFPNKKTIKCIIGLLISLLLPIAVRYFIEEYLYLTFFGFSNYNDTFSVSFYLKDNLSYAFKYAPLGVILYFIQYTFFKEQQSSQLQQINSEMELSLLRSQINPHFLLNALNNIYSLVYQKSETALNAITKLSGLLSYSLYEQKEIVAIETEIRSIQQIIDLQSIRFNVPPKVNLQIDPNIKNQCIPPFLFLPVIENAFKHGDLITSPINIAIKSVKNEIHFSCTNKVGYLQKDSPNGIGLQNIRKRLNLIFPNRHIFSHEEDNGFFNVNIHIPKQ